MRKNTKAEKTSTRARFPSAAGHARRAPRKARPSSRRPTRRRQLRENEERHRAEAGLRKSQSRLTAVLESMPDAFVSFDHNLCYTYVKNAERLQALRASEAKYRDLFEHMAKEVREKEVLLKEIHHRVKNNRQVISSLMDLQADTLQEPRLQGLLAEMRDRVRSMALVHEKLCQSESLARVEFAEYAQSLLDTLWQAHSAAVAGIQLSSQARLDLTRARFFQRVFQLMATK
jgi:two-component sensor histidine kinase